jgi:hypothetical protein
LTTLLPLLTDGSVDVTTFETHALGTYQEIDA